MTLDQLVERERARVRALVTIEGALVALAVGGVLLAVAVAMLGGARWIALPAPLPVAAWLLALAGVLVVAWRTRRAVDDGASRSHIAAEIEREGALRTGAVRVALEAASQGPLGERGARLVAEQLSRRGPVLAPALRRRQRRRGAWAAGAALGVLLVAGGVGATWPDGWQALAHPVDAWRGTLLPALRVDAPGAIVRGERLTVQVEAPGRRAVTLFTRARGRGWERATHAVTDGWATVTLPPLDADLALVADDGRSRSDTVQVRVADRPFLGDVAVRAVYPAYLGRAAEPLATGEPVRVPQGTVLQIQGRASATLRAVALVRGADTLRLAARGQRFDGRVAASAGRWDWKATGLAGPIGDVPQPLQLEIVPDSAPRVAFLDPTRDTTVTPADKVPVSIEASDDHGLATVTLRVWKVGADGRSGEPAVARLASAAPGRWAGETVVDVGAYALVPGEALHLLAEAVDQSPWGQRAVSMPIVLRVPDLAEQRERARRAADSTVAAAAAAATAQKQLAQRTGEAARARGERGGSSKSEESEARGAESPRSRSNDLSYENAEKAKSLAREQRDLSQRVEQLRESARQLEKQLEQAGALDSALAGRLREVQQLLRDALTPELQERLRQLEEAAQNMQADASRNAMSELAQQQQQLREQLEKSVEMLRRAALEGAMQTLRDDARELAARERALADTMARERADQRAGRQDAGDRQAQADQRAKALADRSKRLAEEVARLEERLKKEQAQAGSRRTAEAETHARKSAERMEQAAGKREQGAASSEQQRAETRAGEQQGARQQQGALQQQRADRQSGEQQRGEESAGAEQRAQAAREAAREMEQAADRLGEAREKQIDEWKKELTQELDQAIQETLQLARQEEQLAQQVQQSGPEGARSEQSSIQQGAQQAGQRLEQAGKKSSLLSQRTQRAMADAQRKVGQATQQASEGDSPQRTASAMRDAASALNQAAASLVRDRERANSSKSASGFGEMMEQMRQMAKQQAAVNAQAAGIAQGQPGAQGQQGAAAARALAQQQRGVARDLQDIGDANGEGSGRAEAMAKEAEEIARALERQGPAPETLERQQRLYRRLLDAGRAMEQDERDDTGKRESRAATGDERVTPGGDASGRPATRFREPTWAELRGLTPEERRLVLEYFKRINAAP